MAVVAGSSKVRQGVVFLGDCVSVDGVSVDGEECGVWVWVRCVDEVSGLGCVWRVCVWSVWVDWCGVG